MTRSLVEIVKDNIALEELLLEADGELCPTLEEWMIITEQNKIEKVDAYKSFIEHLEKGSEYFAAKAIEAHKLKKAYDSQIERLKNNLKWSMQQLGVEELAGTDYKYKLSTSKPRVDVYDETKLPEMYTRIKTTVEPNKDVIAKSLEIGIVIPGARLVEGKTLRSYPNKR